VDDTLSQRHMTPTKVLDTLAYRAEPSAALRLVDRADMAILKSRRRRRGALPFEHMKLASGVAPVAAHVSARHQCRPRPRGPAGSNNDFNMFEEMDLAAKLAKVTTLDPQVLPATTRLEMATIRGARVLGLEKEIGSVEPGKRADLIMVRIDRPNAVPLYGAISQMVYALKADDVRDVMVNGKAMWCATPNPQLRRTRDPSKAEEYRAKISASLK